MNHSQFGIPILGVGDTQITFSKIQKKSDPWSTNLHQAYKGLCQLFLNIV